MMNKTLFSAKALFIFLFFFLAKGAVASVSTFSDFFPQQRHIYQSSTQVKDFRLALSELKKINNDWIVDREVFISGELSRRTIELDSSPHIQDVVMEVDTYFAGKQARELYRCDGLDCGSSNAWANNYFKVKQLYGLDPSQAYRVWSLKSGDRELYASSYLVQRGNKRIYLHLDVLTPNNQDAGTYIAADPGSILQALQKERFYEVPKLKGVQGYQTSEELLRPIVAALQQKPFLKVFVVGHDYLGDTYELQQAHSRRYAEQVRELLISMGVAERRLYATGVGSLAPYISHDDSSVFLVIDSTRR